MTAIPEEVLGLRVEVVRSIRRTAGLHIVGTDLQVRVPEDLGDERVAAILQQKRSWIRSKVAELKRVQPHRSKELVTEFQEATQIVGFFDKWDEVTRIKKQIKRSILDQPFGDRALVDSVTERFMDLGKRHFR